jgi:NodT family efflux transporter outer membrane factor (OMF) lipoprotein
MDVGSHFGDLSGITNESAIKSRAVESPASLADWWHNFRDPQLDRLVAEALRSNFDIQIAGARIRQARSERGVAASELFPHVSTDAGYIRARGSKNVMLPLGGGGGGAAASGAGGAGGGGATTMAAQPRALSQSSQASGSSGGNDASQSAPTDQLTPFGKDGLPGVTTELYQVGFDANWEIDVFGGTRRKVEAANAEVRAALEDRRAVMVTLLAEVARDYVQLRGAQMRLDVARQNLAAQNDVLQLTHSMHDSGLSTDFDVARAAALAASTSAQIPPLEAQERQSIHALSILLARPPDELMATLLAEQPLPALPPEVPVGLPSELLERRPDIRRAENELHAATARVGSATADLFPKFTLTGSAGLDSSTINHLLDWQSRYFLISPTAVWPVFDAGRIASNIRLQKANQEEAVLQYRKVVLNALQEVADTLVAFSTEQVRHASLVESAKQSQQALDVARERYKNGLADYLAVLDAQRTLLSAQDTLAQSGQAETINLVALYKALGGGWKSDDGREGEHSTPEIQH